MANAGDETMTGQAQWRWNPDDVESLLSPQDEDYSVELTPVLLNALERDLAQARAEADDVAATAHMMGHASRNDEVRALEAEVEEQRARADRLATYANTTSMPAVDAFVKAADERDAERGRAERVEAQLAQAREALNYIAYAPVQTAGTELIREARDALRRLQGGAEA